MKILVAVDLAECSALACRWVLSKVGGLGVEALVFHHVIDAAEGEDDGLEILEKKTQEVRRFVEALDEGARAKEGFDVAYSVTVGKPDDEILKAAATHEVDAVVMGTHGRKGLNRLFIGSVAETVVRSAPCTVIVVKPGPPA